MSQLGYDRISSVAVSGTHLDEPARVRLDPLRAAEGGIGLIPLGVALDVWEQTRPLRPKEHPLLIAVTTPDERGHQRSSEVIRGHQRSSEVIRGHPRSSEVIRGPQRSSEVLRGPQRSSEVLRGPQRPSESIGGHPRPSESISGGSGSHQPPSEPPSETRNAIRRHQSRHPRTSARRKRSRRSPLGAWRARGPMASRLT